MSQPTGQPTGQPTDSAYPRVLVVSHNPFSDVQNNGKTLQAFFEGWPRERVAQLYLTLDEPSFTGCDRFYRVTDLDVLKDVLPGRSGAAGPVARSDWTRDSAVKSQLGRRRAYRLVRQVFLARPPVALMARSWVWGRGRSDGARMQAWLDEFDPEIVFFQSSSAVFAFDLVEQICAERGIPLVMETTDDYLTPGPRWSPFAATYYRQMQAAYQRAVDRAHTVVPIGEKMAREYAERFGGHYEIAMNSVEMPQTRPPAPLDGTRPALLQFAGNLGLNRWRVLAALGTALDTLASEHGIEAELEIFSIDAPEERVLGALTASPRVHFRGGVDAETLRRHRVEADVLVHVESFDAHNRHITRLSVSTKIPEYMAADRVIVGIGPGDVASIEYLREHETAAVVESPDPAAIAAELARLLSDPARQERLRAHARDLVARNHSRERTREMIRRVVTEAVEESGGRAVAPGRTGDP